MQGQWGQHTERSRADRPSPGRAGREEEQEAGRIAGRMCGLVSRGGPGQDKEGQREIRQGKALQQGWVNESPPHLHCSSLLVSSQAVPGRQQQLSPSPCG